MLVFKNKKTKKQKPSLFFSSRRRRVCCFQTLSEIFGTFHSAFSLTKAPQILEGRENKPFSCPQRPAILFFSFEFLGFLTDQGKKE
jgi:hypothetical protein